MRLTITVRAFYEHHISEMSPCQTITEKLSDPSIGKEYSWSFFLYLFETVPLNSFEYNSQRLNRWNRGLVLVKNWSKVIRCRTFKIWAKEVHRFCSTGNESPVAYTSTTRMRRPRFDHEPVLTSSSAFRSSSCISSMAARKLPWCSVNWFVSNDLQ